MFNFLLFNSSAEPDRQTSVLGQAGMICRVRISRVRLGLGATPCLLLALVMLCSPAPHFVLFRVYDVLWLLVPVL